MLSYSCKNKTKGLHTNTTCVKMWRRNVMQEAINLSPKMDVVFKAFLVKKEMKVF